MKKLHRYLLSLALFVVFCSLAPAQQLTTVQDNAVTLSAGSLPFTGKICFTSPDMVYGNVTYTANTQPSCVAVVAGVFPATQFVPNGIPGVVQGGQSDFYTAIYRTSTNTFIRSEMWVVPPTTTTLSIYQVRKSALQPNLSYILSTKGDDVVCCDATGQSTRVPVGANGTVKTADPTSQYGWSWKPVTISPAQIAAGVGDGTYCIKVLGGVVSLVGGCSAGAGGGSPSSWTSLTNTLWTSLTNSQWTSLSN